MRPAPRSSAPPAAATCGARSTPAASRASEGRERPILVSRPPVSTEQERPMPGRSASTRSSSKPAAKDKRRLPRKKSTGEGSQPPADQPRILSVEEASRLYEGEWVLMRVTGYDQEHNISEGEVLCHSPSRAQISRCVQRVRRQDRSVLLYIFLGGTRRLHGDELRTFLENISGRSYVNARWG